MQNNAGQQPSPIMVMQSGWWRGGGEGLQGLVWFYSLAVEIKSCSLPVSLCI